MSNNQSVLFEGPITRFPPDKIAEYLNCTNWHEAGERLIDTIAKHYEHIAQLGGRQQPGYRIDSQTAQDIFQMLNNFGVLYI